MYRSYTAKDYRAHLGFPEDYTVDAVLCYGTLYEEQMLAVLDTVMGELGLGFELKAFQHPFLRFARELRVGDKNIWFMIGYGGAWISEYIHWACLFGSQKNILIGSCGGLRPGIHRGDFIVPESSYGEESSVRLYNRESPLQLPNADLSAELVKNLDGSGSAVVRGPIVTCQAMIGETLEDVQRWSKEGYAGVEMESSTVFAVSSHFGVPAAASMYVGDNLVEGHTNVGSDYVKEADARQQRQQHQMKAALKTLLS